MEMGSFFSRPEREETRPNKAGGGYSGRRHAFTQRESPNGKSGFLGSSRDLRAPDLRAAPITPSVNWRAKGSNSNTWVLMDPAA